LRTEALILWARRALGRPFAWGRVDCAILACEAYDVLTGRNLAAQYRGRYSTAGEARRFQRRRIDLSEGLKAAGCFAAKPPTRLGDILVAEKDGFLCGHVCLGDFALSAWPDRGVALGRTAEVMALPGAVAMRIA